jgi:gluconate 2-dehydrogenase alpha chain
MASYPGYGDYEVTPYQSTQVQGGTIMAPTPDRGVVNPHLQHWQTPNLFVLGAPTLPNTGSTDPTPTIPALTYRTTNALVDRYLKKPVLLA